MSRRNVRLEKIGAKRLLDLAFIDLTEGTFQTSVLSEQIAAD